VVLRTCTVAVKDLQDVKHSIDVTAETLYEAIATALAALQKDVWVGEIGQGFTTGDGSCPAATGKTRSEDEGLRFVACTSRAFSCGGHAEAKAGENTRQGKPEDMNKKANRINQREQTSRSY
jgi:hypothetical protein